VPEVSVVVASYRWPEALCLSLGSALEQTVENIEVLVVEDGDDTASREVVRETADERVRWSSLRPGSGSQAGPNQRARDLARAPIVAYLGHDDIWDRRHLSGLLDVLTPDVDLAHAATCVIEEPSTVPAHASDPGVPAPEIIGGGVLRLAGLDPWTPETFVPPSSIAHRRSAPQIPPWPDPASTPWPVDYVLMREAVDLGVRIAATGEATVFKVASGLRPDSYRTRNVDPQRRILSALAADPDLGRHLVEYALARGATRHSGAPAPARPGEAADRNRRNRGLPPVFRPRQATWDPGSDLLGRGFHPPERDSGGTYAWIDARGRIAIRLDAPPGRDPLRLRVTIRHVAAPEQLDQLVVDLDGEQVDPEVLPSAEDCIRFGFSLGRPARGPVVEIGFTVPPIVPAEHDPASPDQRVLGVALSRVEVF
jgi:hypothetical protein